MNSSGKSKTGIMVEPSPFKKSIKKTEIPINFELVTSNEFIAPTFPVPSLVISVPLVILSRMYAEGKKPKPQPSQTDEDIIDELDEDVEQSEEEEQQLEQELDKSEGLPK